MNILIRTSQERGHVEFDWLKSAHSFSFGEYYDPSNMGFGMLRVLNDDEIAGGGGFPPHSHRNMEIFTIPLAGSLSHQDSTGTSSTITPGTIQIMSAGTGVTHSEFNSSDVETLKLLQIWIAPHTTNLPPRYDEKHFSFLEDTNKLHTVITPDGKDGTLVIYQDTYVSLGSFTKDGTFIYNIQKKGNGVYLFIIKGTVTVESYTLDARDAAMIQETELLTLHIEEDSCILIIEVPLTS